MRDLRFGEIIDEVLVEMGLTRDTVQPEVLASIKLRINQIVDFITYHKAWEWRKREFYFSTLEPVVPTSVTVTKGSRNVTLGNAVVTDMFKYAYLRINQKMYKIDPRTAFTTTTFNLVAAYPEDDEVSTSAEIVFPDYILRPNISSIISLSINGQELRTVNSEKLLRAKASTGKPEAATIGKVSDFTLYKTGTVQVTNGQTQITGTDTTWTSEMEGQIYRTDEFATPYIIQKVTSNTILDIDEEYQGPNGNGKSYKIGPQDTPLISMRHTPDDIYFVEGVGLAHSRRLVGEDDISPIPNHAPLLHGAIWLALHDKEDKNPFRIQQARADFERTLKELEDAHKVITSTQWQTQEEMRFRQAELSQLDPLDFFKDVR